MKKTAVTIISILFISMCSFSAFAIDVPIIPDDEPVECINHTDYDKNGKCDLCQKVLADVNGDGAVNLKDILRLKRIMAEIPGAQTIETYTDVNCDGDINTLDLTSIALQLFGR